MAECKELKEERDPNCREVCGEIADALDRADEALVKISGVYQEDKGCELTEDGNMSVLEHRLSSIEYRSQRLATRIIALSTRI